MHVAQVHGRAHRIGRSQTVDGALYADRRAAEVAAGSRIRCVVGIGQRKALIDWAGRLAAGQQGGDGAACAAWRQAADVAAERNAAGRRAAAAGLQIHAITCGVAERDAVAGRQCPAVADVCRRQPERCSAGRRAGMIEHGQGGGGGDARCSRRPGQRVVVAPDKRKDLVLNSQRGGVQRGRIRSRAAGGHELVAGQAGQAAAQRIDVQRRQPALARRAIGQQQSGGDARGADNHRLIVARNDIERRRRMTEDGQGWVSGIIALPIRSRQGMVVGDTDLNKRRMRSQHRGTQGRCIRSCAAGGHQLVAA